MYQSMWPTRNDSAQAKPRNHPEVKTALGRTQEGAAVIRGNDDGLVWLALSPGTASVWSLMSASIISFQVPALGKQTVIIPALFEKFNKTMTNCSAVVSVAAA
jgi:hypothetical protein